MPDRRRIAHPWSTGLLALACAGALVAAVLVVGSPSPASGTSERIVTAARGVVQSTVSGSGTVEPARQLDVDFATGGELTHVYVKPGQRVAEGQLLATVDAASAQAALDQAQASLAAAEAATTSSSGTTTASTATASTAAATVAAATTTPATTAPANTTPTTTTPGRAGTGGGRSGGGTTGGGASGGGGTTGGAGTSSSGGTSGGGGTTSGAGTSSGGESPAQKAANVASAEAAVDDAQAALADTSLRAPMTGVVAEVNAAAGEQVSGGGTSGSGSGSSGSGSGSDSSGSGAGGSGSGSGSGSGGTGSAGSGSTGSGFIVLADLDALDLVVPFSESDVGKLRRGQSATVAVNALPNVKHAAHVVSIATLPTSDSGVVSYDVTLRLDQLAHGLKAGMTGTATVVVQRVQNALNVPSAAVTGRSVTLVQGDGRVQRSVVTGLVGDSTTQILGGLRAGDRVAIVSTPVSSAASALAGAGTGAAQRSGGFGRGGGGFALGGGGFAAGGGGPP
ncbi:MAG TPA: biotin/lipoyl-binding protein [Conexibacter sp.]|nr:biotin/lipoyl-binding protein [Conexibacter sp.]